MILFCEDCGQQNELDPAAFADGKAVFICTACSYHNAYKVVEPETGSPLTRKISIFFESIRTIKGVIGAFFYHEKKGVIGNNMPQVLARSDIEALGASFSQSYKAGCATCSDILNMVVIISDKYFFVFKISAQLYVVVVSVERELPEKVSNLVKGCAQGSNSK